VRALHCLPRPARLAEDRGVDLDGGGGAKTSARFVAQGYSEYFAQIDAYISKGESALRGDACL
jgi:hypothetical protein